MIFKQQLIPETHKMYFNNDDDYSEQYNYTRVYDKMMEGLMMENNWNKGSIKSKNNLIFFWGPTGLCVLTRSTDGCVE